MRCDPVATRPCVEGVAEGDDSLAGDRGTPDSTEQLLGLAGEHRPGDDLDPPLTLRHRPIVPVMNDLPLSDALIDMEPILQRGNADSPRVERSRPAPDGSTVVLVLMAAVLVGIVFLLLTSGGAAA